MKIRNFIFSGFMASILMAGAAYAEDTQAGYLTTKSYVDSAARWAKSKGEAAATTLQTGLTNGTVVVNKATSANTATFAEKDLAGNNIGATYATKAEVGTLPQSATATTVVGYVDEKTAAAVSGKANASDVYTKTEADAKFLTEHQDISGKADASSVYTKTEVDALPAVASGITSTKVGNYDEHVADTTIHVTTADKTKWNGYESTIAEHTTSIATNTTNIATNATDIDNLEATVNDETYGLATKASQSDLNTLSATVGTKAAASDVTALAGRVTTAEGDIDALEGLVGDTAVATQISTAVAAEAAIARAAEQANATNIATNATNIASINTQLGNFKCSGSACYVDNAGALQTFSSISSWTDLTD